MMDNIGGSRQDQWSLLANETIRLSVILFSSWSGLLPVSLRNKELKGFLTKCYNEMAQDKCYLFWAISTGVHFYIMQTSNICPASLFFIFVQLFYTFLICHECVDFPSGLPLYLITVFLFCAKHFCSILLKSEEVSSAWGWLETATAANIGCDPFSECVSTRCKGEYASKQESVEDCVSRGSPFGKLVSAYVY